VVEILAETRLDPGALELELTESAVMDNAEQGIGILKELRNMGVEVAIDDFGTGHSSLSYLKRLPITALKIDRSFVRDSARFPDDAAIVEAIISMGHSLRLKVVAEGVETATQADFLASRGCDVMQGFYFSPPVDAEAIAAMARGPAPWACL
jgi:EAL domain-containing protein (putative c-di-GMP-specific phosphodiesterase class I)